MKNPAINESRSVDPSEKELRRKNASAVAKRQLYILLTFLIFRRQMKELSLSSC